MKTLTSKYLTSILGCLFTFNGTELFISSFDNHNVIVSSFDEHVPFFTVEIAKLFDSLSLSYAYVSDETYETIPFFEMYPIHD